MDFSHLDFPEPKIEDNVGVVFVASTLYGAFFILFIQSSLVLHHQVLVSKTRSSGSFGTMVYLTLGYLLFLVVTLTWVLLWIMLTHPELVKDDQNPGGFSIITYAQNVFGVFALVVADWILIYRLYIIWDQRKIIIAGAAVLTIAQLSVGVYQFVYFSNHTAVWVAGNVILYSLPLATNIVATALISWRVWSTSRLSRALGGQGIVRRIVGILVESAALVTVWMITFLVSFLVKREVSHILLYGLPSVAGIGTTLVNVRVGLGWAAGEEGRSTRTFHDDSIFVNDGQFDRRESCVEEG